MVLAMYLMGVHPTGVHKTKPLGYWRKHPNLHGWFVRQYGGWVDECQEIPITLAQLEETLKASEEDRLPHTEGFFFGRSMPEYKAETKKILTKVIAWQKKNPKAKIYYQASW